MLQEELKLGFDRGAEGNIEENIYGPGTPFAESYLFLYRQNKIVMHL